MRIGPVLAIDGHPEDPVANIQVGGFLGRYDRRVGKVGYAILPGFLATPLLIFTLS